MTRKKQDDGCGIKVNVVTAKGGAVVFNVDHGVWASYAVAGIGASAPPEIMYAGIKLKSGKAVQIVVNRETGMITVDEISGSGGVEVFRRVVG